jgi:hypothetical protein
VRTSVKVFLGSSAFILASAALYWFVAYEWAGTILLTGTGTATLVMAAYSWLRIRKAPTEPVEDRDDVDPGAGAGEPVVAFAEDSPWPIVFAIGVAVVAGGLVFGVPLLIVGAVVVVAAAIGMMRESVA